MTKSELVDKLALQNNLPQKVSDEVIDLVFNSMADALIGGDKIEIRGFGSFTIREYDGRTGRNPKTGKLVEVKPKKTPFFKVGKELKERILES